MRAVVWSKSALNDIRAQVSYIAAERPEMAQRVADQLRATGRALGLAATGRPGRVTGTYEKTVSGLPYVFAYQLYPDRIVILRVIHTARNWPKGHWPG